MVYYKRKYKTRFSNTKGRKWKFKTKHAYKDYDKDGKVNKYDCRPLNKYRQDYRGKKKWSDLTEFEKDMYRLKMMKEDSKDRRKHQSSMF